MVDLLENAQTPYVRISSRAKCHLAIAHRMIGTAPRYRADYTDMNLRVGTALEPTINQWMADNGAQLAFVGKDQLRVAVDDPYSEGHPDGLIWFNAASDMTKWMQRQLASLPIEISMRLANGEMFLWEVKTMNPDSWTMFNRQGLKGSVFLTDYITQVNTYLHALNNTSGEELWMDDEFHTDPTSGEKIRTGYGAAAYRALLRDTGLQRPTAAIVVGLNKANSRFAFDVVEYDAKRYATESADLQKVTDALHAGYLPAPSKDGAAAECWHCSYAYLCPNVAALKSNADDLDLLATSTVNHAAMIRLEELCDAYKESIDELDAAKSRKEDLRTQIDNLITNELQSARVKSINFSVSKSEVRGRKTLDTEVLELLAKEYGFDIPYKTGSAHTRLRVTNLYGDKIKDA